MTASVTLAVFLARAARTPFSLGEFDCLLWLAEVGSIFTRRRRPGISFWTDHDQRERSYDDAFCDRVAAYSAGTTKTWPM